MKQSSIKASEIDVNEFGSYLSTLTGVDEKNIIVEIEVDENSFIVRAWL